MPPIVLDVRTADDHRDLIHRAVEALAAGKLIAVPTETVYGLAASASHPTAVEQLIEAKGRGTNHPFALAVKSSEDALDLAPGMSPLARRLARRCWPGPVTLVVEQGPPEQSLVARLPEPVRKAVAQGGTLGLRASAHCLMQEILKLTAGPVLLTSANRSGDEEANSARQIEAIFGDQLAAILDDGPCRYGQPSTVVRVVGSRYEVLRVGVVAEATIRRLAAVMVLMVCTGNTCRSPMAEALMQKHLAKRLNCIVGELDQRGAIVMSAGIAAGNGARPSPESVEVMREMGVDLNGHVSQPVSASLIRHADLILTMTQGHRDVLLEHWPEAADRIKPLRPDELDIADPIGGSREVYRACAQQIDEALQCRSEEIEF